MDSSDADTISHVVWALIYLSEVVSSVPTLELEEYSFLGLGKIGLKGVIAKGGMKFLSEVMKMFPKLIVVIVSHICEYTKTVELTL